MSQLAIAWSAADDASAIWTSLTGHTFIPPKSPEPLGIPASTHAESASGIGGAQIGEHRLAGDRGLSLGDKGLDALRQIDVDARAEPDHADPLAGADRVALAHEGNDAPRDQAGDLHDADSRPAGGDHERIALVVLAGLVEIGVDELAGRIHHALDAPARRAAIHVTIEHAHEDRDARQRNFAEMRRQFLGR